VWRDSQIAIRERSRAGGILRLDIGRADHFAPFLGFFQQVTLWTIDDGMIPPWRVIALSKHPTCF
jgi:hypothetical protein